MSRAAYEPVPSGTFDAYDEFKDKPIRPRGRRPWLRTLRRCCRPRYLLSLFSISVILQCTLNASYLDAWAPAYDLDEKETVFIAANIIDGDLIRGAWGRSLLQLVDRIGKGRVFVSIYGGPKDALKELEGMLECEVSVVAEEDEPLNVGAIPRITLPTGESRIKRIAYLAEVRNKVLEPLGKKGSKRWDKVLFINDVYFDPEGATRLLWGTKNWSGSNEYKAVCAADFVTSWKYYDTFATRDVEGYSIGVPIFPWFGAEGDAITRNDILAGKDNVRVKSCWGGMVAFDGKYFQESTTEGTSASQHFNSIDAARGRNGIGPPPLPLRFRSEPEPFWDSSECCLIHADIMSLPSASDYTSKPPYDLGIYMNPYVRTAYSAGAFKYIWLAKRFERLFSPLQRIITPLVHLPRWNYRRDEIEGEVREDQVWISKKSNLSEEEAIAAATRNFEQAYNGYGTKDALEGGVKKRATLGREQSAEFWSNEGHYTSFNRTAKRGGYCGVRQLLVVKEEVLGTGGGNWDNLLDRVPPVNI